FTEFKKNLSLEFDNTIIAVNAHTSAVGEHLEMMMENVMQDKELRTIYEEFMMKQFEKFGMW
ncbi:MAG: hypothetical protein LBO69_04990, partial [Ignavibacteria bacterium]|nr:hypothetical protein [Ignavibacteria bacterium]